MSGFLTKIGYSCFLSDVGQSVPLTAACDARSLAHNNRVSLGPKDLRTLADVLSTEKRLIEA